jgi:hypothetical protein
MMNTTIAATMLGEAFLPNAPDAIRLCTSVSIED